MIEPVVSIIMPVYNESAFIDICMESLMKQTYPKDKMEWIIIDGISTDDTVEKLKKYSDYINLHILKNEKRLVTYALNIGIQHACGKYIIRMDAHAEYAEDYIEKCIYYLEHTDADNVGGIAFTEGKGFVGKANSEILSSKFGVGNSKFRTECKSGYVDTVPFGAFRREIFDRIGLFDPELPRSEDGDFNSRIRSNGGKVFLASDIQFTYYCRNTVKGLLSQAIKNGNALFLTFRKNPKAMSLRHYIPFLFVMSLVVLPIISIFLPFFRWILAAEAVVYFLFDLFFCLKCSKRAYFFYKLIMYLVFHISYGLGSLLGLLNIKLY